MTDYKPGRVASVRAHGHEYHATAVRGNKGWYSNTWGFADDGVVTDVRPLIVLDFTPAPEHLPRLLGLLRNNFWFDLADQIEAQTKPPRIPEPGLWGVVEAHIDGEHGPQADCLWIHTRSGWETVASMQRVREWDDLIAPTLIREGVE